MINTSSGLGFTHDLGHPDHLQQCSTLHAAAAAVRADDVDGKEEGVAGRRTVEARGKGRAVVDLVQVVEEQRAYRASFANSSTVHILLALAAQCGARERELTPFMNSDEIRTPQDNTSLPKSQMMKYWLLSWYNSQKQEPTNAGAVSLGFVTKPGKPAPSFKRRFRYAHY